MKRIFILMFMFSVVVVVVFPQKFPTLFFYPFYLSLFIQHKHSALSLAPVGWKLLFFFFIQLDFIFQLLTNAIWLKLPAILFNLFKILKFHHL